jgi:hypothetical protein
MEAKSVPAYVSGFSGYISGTYYAKGFFGNNSLKMQLVTPAHLPTMTVVRCASG